MQEYQMKEKISIVIPIYNIQEYIPRCLDSLLKQTYSNLEVICVVDGATDDSEKICREYEAKDDRVKVHAIKNQGVSNARNYGLSKVRGEWFAFVDGDDWLEPNFYEVLYRNAISNQCVISACCYERNTEYHMNEKKEDAKEFLVVNSPKECIHNFICSGLSLNGMIWNKIYRTDAFKDVCFDTSLRINEDCMYTYEVMKKCVRACVCVDRLYHWYQRSDSACHSKRADADFGPADVFYQLYKKTQDMDDVEVQVKLKQNYVQLCVSTILNSVIDKDDEEVKAVLKRCKVWRKDVWKAFDGRMKLKYILAVYCISIIRFLK